MLAISYLTTLSIQRAGKVQRQLKEFILNHMVAIPHDQYMQSPTAFIIFGATGDLSQRKLLPALFDLYLHQRLPEKLRIIGFSRESHTTESFQQFVAHIIDQKKMACTPGQLQLFLELFTYQVGLFEDGQSYLRLAEELIAWEREKYGMCSNKLFYLAVPPNAYETIFTNLAHSGLSIPCSGNLGWTRVVVEKPFGKDLPTAQALDRLLGLLFKEEQIFRVDHYLAKETVQNILAWRFSNSLFEPLWDNEDIEKVEIKFWEDIGVGERGSFYEDTGALRDIGQNHMLQMLALIAMEDPGKLSAAHIRRERAKVLNALRPVTTREIGRHMVRGQYEGYLQETNVQAASQTETYFRLRVFVDNDRWRGIPFYLESGKRLTMSKAEINVFFRARSNSLTNLQGDALHQNVLTFRIQPNEGISLVFWAKKPGFDFALEPRVLSFNYREGAEAHELPDAYERVLFDCIRGDQTLFASTQEVSAAWKFITPILDQWHTLPLQNYPQGSRGPHFQRANTTASQ